MDLALTALSGAVHLAAISHTLRRIYQPCFVTPEPIKIALTRLVRFEVASVSDEPSAPKERSQG